MQGKGNLGVAGDEPVSLRAWLNLQRLKPEVKLILFCSRECSEAGPAGPFHLETGLSSASSGVAGVTPEPISRFSSAIRTLSLYKMGIPKFSPFYKIEHSGHSQPCFLFVFLYSYNFHHNKLLRGKVTI